MSILSWMADAAARVTTPKMMRPRNPIEASVIMATVAVESHPLRQKFLKPKWKMREIMVNMMI